MQCFIGADVVLKDLPRGWSGAILRRGPCMGLKLVCLTATLALAIHARL